MMDSAALGLVVLSECYKKASHKEQANKRHSPITLHQLLPLSSCLLEFLPSLSNGMLPGCLR